MKAPVIKMGGASAAPAAKSMMAAGKKAKIPHPRLRARKLNIAGKSEYSSKTPAFHPSGGLPGAGPAVANAGGIPGAGGEGIAGAMPPDAAFESPQQ